MKMSQLFMSTLREVPAEAVIVSHRLMLRSGMMRKLGNGLFAYLPFGLRAFRKVETIVREEMNAIGAQECKQPVVVPGELWRESGRWDTMGSAMLRATNRVNQELVISPTAEEAFTALVRDELSSYKQLPISLYQINTKYRDEIRPRYGVMRGREFTMKDAYSFHANAECLDKTYTDFGKAYRRIFKRCGLSVIPVCADSGAMGGSGSEEFMIESEIGDDTLILCPSCNYAANEEKASCAPDTPDSAGATDEKPVKIKTPHVRTIEELTAFLHTGAKSFIKTLIYEVHNSQLSIDKKPITFVAVCIRGDLDINEAKLAANLKASEVVLAMESDVERITGAPVGFAGPVGLTGVPVISDESVMSLHDSFTGALEADMHFAHVEPQRDFTSYLIADVRTVHEGDKCPHCGGTFYTKKGNELGHIFKLGYKYTDTMNVHFLDEEGKTQKPLMGCYGIGIDRALASIIEEHHDNDGIIFPMSVAPFQVIIVPIKYEGIMKETSDALYDALRKENIDVALDDRQERPGVKFKDSDLLGIPLRVVIGEKNLPNVEIKLRSSQDSSLVAREEACSVITRLVQEALKVLHD